MQLTHLNPKFVQGYGVGINLKKSMVNSLPGKLGNLSSVELDFLKPSIKVRVVNSTPNQTESLA